MTTPLHERQCSPQHGPAMSEEEARPLLLQLPGWAVEVNPINGMQSLVCTFRFTDFHATMAFVNGIADIANSQDHHPEMLVSYNQCTVHWNTHSVKGLSISDFICAAQVDHLRATTSA